MRIFVPTLACLLVAGTARADVIMRDPCEGKKEGDPCRGFLSDFEGTCSKVKVKEGEKYVGPPLECLTELERNPPPPAPKRPAEDDRPLKPAEPPPPAGWCSVADPTAPGGLALILVGWRRRRRRSV